MRANGASDSDIARYRGSGFFAAVYKNDKTGEIIVAYRGTDLIAGGRVPEPRDLSADVRARFGEMNLQYEAASRLATMVRTQWTQSQPGRTITLTGHSLGGGLASFAAQEQHIDSVYTFNAARNPFSTSGTNPNQVNVAVPGELIGDPNTSTRPQTFGTGSLPGQTYHINTTSDQSGIFGGHDIDGIIGGIREVIRPN